MHFNRTFLLIFAVFNSLNVCLEEKNDTLLVLEIVIEKCDMHFFIAGEMENAFSNDREQGQDDSYARIRASDK